MGRDRGSARHVLLGALVVVAGLRAVAAALVLPLWDPIDERAHYAYVEGLAEGRGLAVLEDPLPLSVQELAKASPTGADRSAPLAPADLGGRQHEAAQGPLAYALLAPVHRLAGGLDPATRVLLVRVANALLTVVPAVLLTWAIAGALFPGHPSVAPLATALLVGWPALDAAGARVSNDGVVIPLVLAAVYGIARVARDGAGLRWAVLAGGGAGLAVLAKATTAAVAPVLAVAAVGALVLARAGPARAARWVAVTTACAALPVLPWLAVQHAVYGPGGAVERFNAQVGPLVGRFPATAGTLVRYAREAAPTLFGLDLRPFPQPTLVALAGAYAVLVLVGVAVAWRGGRRREAWHLLWLAAAVPLTFAGLAAVVQLALDGYGGTPGRYLAPALPLLAVAVAGAARLGLGRVGAVAVAVLVAVGVQHQIGQADAFVSAAYLGDLPGPGLAPVVVQEHADAATTAAAVTVSTPCTPRALALGFPGPPPAALRIRDATGERSVALARTSGARPDALFGTYPLTATARDFTVAFDPGGQRVLAAAADRHGRVALVAPGAGSVDPVVRVACQVPDPEVVRFAQTYWPQHPDLPLAAVRAWPRLWAGAAWTAAAAVLVTAAGAVPGRAAPAGVPARRRPSPVGLR